MSSLLDRVEIAKPCPASWDGMTGDERVRFCNLCKLNVYNLSEMTRKEAEDLIIEKEGKLCARLYRRADGTIITNDCPIGVKLLRHSIERCISAAAFLIALFVPGKVIAQEFTGQLVDDHPARVKVDFGSKVRLIEDDLQSRVRREKQRLKEMERFWKSNKDVVIFSSGGNISPLPEFGLKQNLFDVANTRDLPKESLTALDAAFECDLFNAYVLDTSSNGIQIQRTLRPAEIRARAPEAINLLSVPGTRF